MYYKTNRFYHSSEWRRLRKEVLIDDKNECVMCRAKGKYKRANTVHHVNYLQYHPELALDKYYVDANGKRQRNLISLCHDCHEQIHGYRQKEKEEPLTIERW